jgi:integrase
MSNNDNKYLLLRGKTYWARVSVPRTLQHLLGEHLRESLKTGDVQEANRRKLAVVVILKNRIDEAKLSGKPKEPQFLRDWQVWRKRLQELRVADDFIGSTAEDYLQRAHLSTNRVALEAEEHSLMDKLKGLALTIGDEQAEILYRKITEPKALLSELVSEYLALQTLSYDTQRKSKTALSELLGHMKEDVPPHKIDPYEMLAFTDTLNSSKLTPNTRRDRRSALSQFWKWLERRLHAPKDSNPFTKRDVEIKGGTEEAAEAFKPNEVELILNADFIQPWRRDVFLVLMYTGARPTEICSLKMKHIDIENRTFLIEASKTNAGVRLLPYTHSVLVKIFSKYYSADPERADELLFPMVVSKSERQGKPYINFFSRLKNKLKLRNEACLYSARKSFMSTCLDLQLDHVNIERYVGHKSGGKENKLLLTVYMQGRSNLGLVEIANKFHYPYTVE